MAELTDSGMLKEWWANPAVVGLMGFEGFRAQIHSSKHVYRSNSTQRQAKDVTLPH